MHPSHPSMRDLHLVSSPALLRPGLPEDAAECGRVCFEAFRNIAEAHGFPPDFPTMETAVELFRALLKREDIYSVIAERDGRIVGSNFLWQDGVIAGVGPITVEPTAQNDSTGRRLMERVMEHGQARGAVGVRLVQAAYHNRSLSLYTKLGFDAREPLSVMQGSAIGEEIPGLSVRPVRDGDVETCNALCLRVHGHRRDFELRRAVGQKSAVLVEHAGRVSGYSTGVGFFGHAVAENNESLAALIAAAETFGGPGFLLPTRNAELLRWCLARRLRIVLPMTLMSFGLYNEPAGVFLPSVLY